MKPFYVFRLQAKRPDIEIFFRQAGFKVKIKKIWEVYLTDLLKVRMSRDMAEVDILYYVPEFRGNPKPAVRQEIFKQLDAYARSEDESYFINWSKIEKILRAKKDVRHIGDFKDIEHAREYALEHPLSQSPHIYPWPH